MVKKPAMQDSRGIQASNGRFLSAVYVACNLALILTTQELNIQICL